MAFKVLAVLLISSVGAVIGRLDYAHNSLVHRAVAARYATSHHGLVARQATSNSDDSDPILPDSCESQCAAYLAMGNKCDAIAEDTTSYVDDASQDDAAAKCSCSTDMFNAVAQCAACAPLYFSRGASSLQAAFQSALDECKSEGYPVNFDVGSLSQASQAAPSSASGGNGGINALAAAAATTLSGVAASSTSVNPADTAATTTTSSASSGHIVGTTAILLVFTLSLKFMKYSFRMLLADAVIQALSRSKPLTTLAMLSLYSFTVVALSAVSLFSAAQAANVNKRQDASQSCQSVCGLFSSSLQSNCGAFVPGITAIISGGGVPDINNQQVQQALACFCNNELVKEFTDHQSVSSLPTAASASAAASDASSSDATAGTTSAAATTSNQATPAQPASTSASSSSSVPTTTQSVTKNGASSTSSTSAVVIAVLSVAGLVMATF
ncbi:hypothetical protein EMMF5_004021 [Cystobasidiomycetes sp. EMM_F5]